MNVLHVLGRLVELEPAQSALLDAICAGPLLTHEELESAGAFVVPASARAPSKRRASPKQEDLF